MSPGLCFLLLWMLRGDVLPLVTSPPFSLSQLRNLWCYFSHCVDHFVVFFLFCFFFLTSPLALCFHFTWMGVWCVNADRNFVKDPLDWSTEICSLSLKLMTVTLCFLCFLFPSRTIWSPLSMGGKLCGKTQLPLFLQLHHLPVFSHVFYIWLCHHTHHPA